MLHGGARGGGGGGGFHHHHHHHAAGAFIAGAAIGAAASRSRNNAYYGQPNVVVVSAQPTVYATTTTAYPTTTTYVAPAPVVVVPPPKRKRPLGIVVGCVFMIVIIICLSVLPMPGTAHRTLLYGEQRVDWLDGDFIESVNAYYDGGEDLSFFAYTRLPEKTGLMSYSLSHSQSIPSNQYFDAQFKLFEGSYVYTTVDVNDDCIYDFYVFRGQSHYDSWTRGGFPNYETYATITDDVTISYYVDALDDYYFVIYNPYCSYPGETAAVFGVEAVAYDTSSTADLLGACLSTDPCTFEIPYPKNVYLIAQSSTSSESQSPPPYNIRYELHGRWYTYTLLYVGLFIGMVVCSACATAIAKKKEREELEAAPLLHAQNPPQQQPVYAAAPTYATQTEAPPPYAPNV